MLVEQQLAGKARIRYYGSNCHMPRNDPFTLDGYVVDALLPDLVGHDRQASAFLVWLFLWRHSQRSKSRGVSVALQDLAEQTGLAKRTVQSALAHLAQRKLLAVERTHLTAVPTYTPLTPWRRN
jgi:hypothetical protein